MNEVNVLSPVTNKKELNNITEIRSLDEFSLLPAPETDADILREIFNDMYDAVENADDLLTADSPEVQYAKFLYVIRLKVEAMEKIRATAEKLIQNIQDWANHKTSQHQSQIDFLSGRMEAFLRAQRLKSLQLPSGTIGLRKQQPRIELTDPDKFYENASADLLRHIPESYQPDMKNIRTHIKTTGEIPVGLDVIEQESKFYYKLND